MLEALNRDQDIAWPSYVDFLSTFCFILLIFLASLLYILSGDIGERRFHTSIARTQQALEQAHVQNWVRGKKLYISLKDQVQFETGCPDPTRASCPSTLSAQNTRNLRRVAEIVVTNPGWNRIVIEGRADAIPYHDPKTGRIDEFGNFALSARRAMQVLQFFHSCSDCGYNLNVVRSKLVLSGLGTRNDTGSDRGERRVDLVLDYSENIQ